MLIEIYRNDVQEAYDELLKVSNPPERKEMDACVRGDTHDFYLTYCSLDEEGDEDWWTHEHCVFYRACESLKDKEHEEYKRAMQWVPA